MSWHTVCRSVAAACLSLMVLVSLPASPRADDAADPRRMPAALLMVDDAGCVYCRKWDREVAQAYENSAEGQRAPLVRRPIRSADVAAFPGIRYTPTFLLLVEGREIGRIIGYAGAEFFWGELAVLMAKSGLQDAPRKPSGDIRTDVRPGTPLPASARPPKRVVAVVAAPG